MLKPPGDKTLPVAPAARTVGTLRSIETIRTIAGTGSLGPIRPVDPFATRFSASASVAAFAAIPTARAAPVFPKESIAALASSYLFLQRLKARPAFLKFGPAPLELTAQIQ
jgi:hypothetical protein